MLSLAFAVLSLSMVKAAPPSEDPTTGAICQTTFGWMNNSLTQSPCLVSAYLMGACATGYWNVPALPVGTTYKAPTQSQANICTCSSVTYSAMSACAACQVEPFLTWPAWKLNCDQSFVTVASYNMTIPDRTAVPRWMLQNPELQIGNTLNLTYAQAVQAQNLPDVTQKNQGPIGSPAVTASTTSVAAETTSATPAIKHSSNIGPIVGGTIGGIGVLVLILVLACLVFRARRRWHGSQAPSQQYINKWSKNVPIGGSSGWMGTPFSASVSGDPIKEGDMMSGSYPYSVEPRSTINSPTYLDQARARGSISPTRSDGHQSSTKPRRGFHLHSPAASNVTPFVLPPLAAPTVVTGSAALSHDGTSMISSNVAQHSHRGSQQAATTELPSKIEYLGQRRPPVPTTSTNAAGVSTIGSRNGSRTSFSSLLPGQYNPDDPSTFLAGASAGGSSERNDVERPGYRRHHSSDLPPSSFNPLSPLSPSSGSGNYPDAQQEKAALARQYAQTPATRGHHSSSMSPPQLSPPQLNTNLAMTASVHTLPGLPTPNPTTPLEPPTSHTPSESVPAEPNSFLSTWRKKANRRSVDLDADPVPTWAQQGSADDFDPYRMT